jgi:hypothetical protein
VLLPGAHAVAVVVDVRVGEERVRVGALARERQGAQVEVERGLVLPEVPEAVASVSGAQGLVLIDASNASVMRSLSSSGSTASGWPSWSQSGAGAGGAGGATTWSGLAALVGAMSGDALRAL